MSPRHRWLEVEQIGEVTVVKFLRRQILTGETVEVLGQQLLSLVCDEGRRKVVLNFANVDRLASATLGKLLLLHRHLRAAGGWLVLCQIPPHLYEVFAILKLPRVLAIRAHEQEALQILERRA
jgi:anti-sigma B factor antagonist